MARQSLCKERRHCRALRLMLEVLGCLVCILIRATREILPQAALALLMNMTRKRVRVRATTAALEVARHSWVFFALPFRLSVLCGISDLIWNGIGFISPFGGKLGSIYTLCCCVSSCVLGEECSNPPSYYISMYEWTTIWTAESHWYRRKGSVQYPYHDLLSNCATAFQVKSRNGVWENGTGDSSATGGRREQERR